MGQRLRIGAAYFGALVFALGGCTVGPTYVPPEAPVPKDWKAGNDPRVAARTAADTLWWRRFNDPTLDRLVETAYRQNLPLQVAGLRIVEARAQVGLATGMLYPQSQTAFANGKAVGLSQNISRIGNLPRNYLAYQAGFDAAWELDFWGKYRRGIEAEAAGMYAAMADYYAAVVSLTAEIARTYVEIRMQEVLIEQARANVRIQEQALDIAESRFRNGATSELDPTQAKTLLESTRATIPQRETTLQQTRNALGTLLGQPPGTVEALLEGPKTIPTAPAEVAVEVPSEVLRRRPDIRSAEFNAIAQCARIGVAKADLYPSFSLVGTVGLDASTRGTANANLFAPSSLFYTVGPQIGWKFLNYGRIKNSVRIQDARFQQLLVAYRDTVLRAAQEVEDALIAFLNAQQSLVFAQNAATSAQRSVDLALAAYREGTADYQRVLEAERALLQQQNGVAETTSSIATSLIALYKALGGGWETRQGDPLVPEPTRRQMEDRTNWGDILSRTRAPTETKLDKEEKKH